MTLYQGKYRIESARYRDWNYTSRGWYFVTICTKNHEHTFVVVRDGGMQLSGLGRIADSELRRVPGHYQNVDIDCFVVMPNHVHAIVAIDGDHKFSPDAKFPPQNVQLGLIPPQAGSLSAIVRSYKAGVTRMCRESEGKQNVWQSRFHDHLLRGDKVINAVREYIRNNPANWGQDKENIP